MKPRHLLFIAMGITTGLLASLVVSRLGSGTGVEAWNPNDPFLPEPLPAPSLRLTDHEGRPFELRGLRGRPVAVFFGYTHCPDICPVTLANLTRARSELGVAGARVAIVFVSVDPARDTPGVLARFREGLGSDLIAVTGPEDELHTQAAGFGVTFLIPSAPGQDYTVEHTARTYLLDGEGRIVGTLAPLPSVAHAAETLRALLERVG